MNLLQNRRNWLMSSVGLLSVAWVMGTSIAANAQPGKYRGSSASWVPDYAGTIRIQVSGQENYTAVADVELKQKPTSIYDPNPTAFQYEMRGAIALTTPYIVSQRGKIVMTCIPVSPVPVSIADSGMSIYTNDEQMPKNSYEFIISQFVRLSQCTDASGRVSRSENQSMQVRFNTSDRPASASNLPRVTLSPEEQAALAQQGEAAQAIANHPALQREFERMIQRDEAEFRRTGKKPSAEAILADVERLRQQGLLPKDGEMPSIDPALQRKLEAQKSDYSHLRRFTNINHLKDQMTVDHGVVVLNVSWDLRRVNGR